MLGKRRALGRTIDKLEVGETIHLTEKMTDKDLLLYLGLTNDNNPLYLQHDLAALTPYERPIIPTIMLVGFITSAISKYVPGPGSHVVEQQLRFPNPVYHYDTIEIDLQVTAVHLEEQSVVITVHAMNREQQTVVEGALTVLAPPAID